MRQFDVSSDSTIVRGKTALPFLQLLRRPSLPFLPFLASWRQSPTIETCVSKITYRERYREGEREEEGEGKGGRERKRKNETDHSPCAGSSHPRHTTSSHAAHLISSRFRLLIFLLIFILPEIKVSLFR